MMHGSTNIKYGVHWPCETLHKTNVHRLNILTGVRQGKSLKVEQLLSFPEENAVDLYGVGDGVLGINNGGTALPIPNHYKVNCKLRSQ